MFNRKFLFQFLFVLGTLVFHIYLFVKMTIDERYLLTVILVIPISIFSYRLFKLIRQMVSFCKNL